jgi:hypothetical protein
VPLPHHPWPPNKIIDRLDDIRLRARPSARWSSCQVQGQQIPPICRPTLALSLV